MPGGTMRDLQQALWKGPWHIFHFVGHGGFERPAARASSSWPTTKGDVAAVSATDLAGCWATTSRSGWPSSTPARARGATRTTSSRAPRRALVRRGTPAVVAMQYEITDDAAIEFSRSFYEAIADGHRRSTARSPRRARASRSRSRARSSGGRRSCSCARRTGCCSTSRLPRVRPCSAPRRLRWSMRYRRSRHRCRRLRPQADLRRRPSRAPLRRVRRRRSVTRHRRGDRPKERRPVRWPRAPRATWARVATRAPPSTIRRPMQDRQSRPRLPSATLAMRARARRVRGPPPNRRRRRRPTAADRRPRGRRRASAPARQREDRMVDAEDGAAPATDGRAGVEPHRWSASRIGWTGRTPDEDHHPGRSGHAVRGLRARDTGGRWPARPEPERIRSLLSTAAAGSFPKPPRPTNRRTRMRPWLPAPNSRPASCLRTQARPATAATSTSSSPRARTSTRCCPGRPTTRGRTGPPTGDTSPSRGSPMVTARSGSSTSMATRRSHERSRRLATGLVARWLADRFLAGHQRPR